MANNQKDAANASVLTPEQVRAEIQADEERLAKKRQILEMIEEANKLGYALVPNVETVSSADEVAAIWRKPTWGTVVPDILSRADRGMTPGEIIEAAKATGVFHLLVGLKGVYNNLLRLCKDGKAVNHEGLYYLTPLFRKLKESGQLPPKARRKRRPHLRRSIIPLLQTHVHGLTAEKLAEALRQMPHATTNIKMEPSYIFKVLRPMVARGELVKEGDIYRLPEKASGRTLERPATQDKQLSVAGPRRTSGKLVGKGGLPH